MAEEETTKNLTKDEKVQVVTKIEAASNILVTVSNSPSVDELTAALALTMILDKMGKHATAIFSGKVPDALEFLEPGQTFENNVDSLRDFIISLNKDKADHLRYKIEGDYVRVFITPYKTTISESDLEFSQGDYNVELVLALNVKSHGDLDSALGAHGKILHDATVVNITTSDSGSLGNVVWANREASSLSELVILLADALKDNSKEGDLIDMPVATVLLTGIVAATDRFSNANTKPDTLTLASRMMSYGADQQAIVSNLAKKEKEPEHGNLEVEQEEPKVELTTAEEDVAAAARAAGFEKEKLDQVATETAENRQEEAARLAEQRLTEGMANVRSTEQETGDVMADLAQASEQAAAPVPEPTPVVQPTPAPMPVVPAVEPAKETPKEPEALQGAVSGDAWKRTRTPVGYDKPVAGMNSADALPGVASILDTPPGVSPGAEASVEKPSGFVIGGAAPVVEPAAPEDTGEVLPPPPPPPPPPDFGQSIEMAMPPSMPDFNNMPSVDLPVMPEVAAAAEMPVVPAANVAENGIQPVMQDQVYPQVADNDPGQFKIPGV